MKMPNNHINADHIYLRPKKQSEKNASGYVGVETAEKSLESFI